MQRTQTPRQTPWGEHSPSPGGDPVLRAGLREAEHERLALEECVRRRKMLEGKESDLPCLGLPSARAGPNG